MRCGIREGDVRITATHPSGPRRAVDLDDIAVWIEQVKLGETGRAIATDHDTHRVVLRRVFAKTVGSQSGERAVKIIGTESKMTIAAVDVASPEGADPVTSFFPNSGTIPSLSVTRSDRSIL